MTWIAAAIIAAPILYLLIGLWVERRVTRPRPEIVLNEDHPRNGADVGGGTDKGSGSAGGIREEKPVGHAATDVSDGLPHREKDWRNSPGIEWSDPRYFGGTRRRP
jgi:hypothetical protein